MLNGLIVLLVAICLLIFGLVALNESQANRIQAEARAEAMIIRAQAESRLTAAQAGAITMTAALPLVMVITGGLVGFVFAAALLTFAIRYRPARPQIVERQIIYLVEPGQPRREVWRGLSAASALPAPAHYQPIEVRPFPTLSGADDQ